MSTAQHRRSWLQERRFRSTVRQLVSLSPGELRALGIRAEDITRLAAEVSRL